MIRPGAFDITHRGLALAAVPAGARCLEIGCGQGETVACLSETYGYKVSAVDTSLEMVRKAKERNPQADISYGDGEFLDNFCSKSFDLVVMECVLSLINMADEALHEIYCVLKKGGRLFISDMYLPKVDPLQIKVLAMEAKIEAARQRKHQECGDGKDIRRAVAFRTGGCLLLDQLRNTLDDMGFVNVVMEDRTKDLQEYVAKMIMRGDCGGEERCLDIRKYPKGTGYFLLVAEKG